MRDDSLVCHGAPQGLTGRPGDAGPQGKVGPSVSSMTICISLYPSTFKWSQHDKIFSCFVCLFQYWMLDEQFETDHLAKWCSYHSMTYKRFHQIKLREFSPRPLSTAFLFLPITPNSLEKIRTHFSFKLCNLVLTFSRTSGSQTALSLFFNLFRCA